MEKTTIFKKNVEIYQTTFHRDYNNIPKDLETEDFVDSTKPKFFKFKALKTDDTKEIFIENYGNPLATVFKEYYCVVVETNDIKSSFKIFWGQRTRVCGKPYFKISKNVRYITINKLTGDYYYGELLNFQKKKKFTKRLRKNYFSDKSIYSFKNIIKNIFSKTTQEDGNAIFNDAVEVLFHSLGIKNELDPHRKILKFYLDKKQFKYPNNFSSYFENYWEPDFRKVLKKNDKKIVESFMIYNGLQGKQIRKALHNSRKLNFGFLKNSIGFFGDWINKNYVLILDILNSENHGSGFPENARSNFSREEMKRIFNIFCKAVQEDFINLHTFYDHMSMYVQLKGYGEENLKWVSDGSNSKKFMSEHLDWTNKLEFYKKGTYTRNYPTYVYESLKPIVCDSKTYYPILLDNSENYNEESNTQSHCVKTYIGRPSSWIISIREDSPTSEKRATLEFEISKNKIYDKIEMRCVQIRGKYNSALEKHWDEPINRIKEIVFSWVNHKNFKNVSIEKVCTNGVKLFSESDFDKNGRLDWTYKLPMDNLFYGPIFI